MNLKTHTTISIDPDLKAKAIEAQLNISKITEIGIQRELGLLNGMTLEFLHKEEQRILAEIQALTSEKENDLLIIRQKIKDYEGKQKTIDEMRTDKFVLESIKAIKEDPKFFNKRLDQIRNYYHVDLPEATFREWVNS